MSICREMRKTPMFNLFKNTRKFDLVVYALILSLGAMEFALSSHAAGFLNDTHCVELAKSVLNRADYGFNHTIAEQISTNPLGQV
jgi:hypothetical protein